MKNLRKRIRILERETADANRRFRDSRRVFRNTLRRKLTSPAALLSFFAMGVTAGYGRCRRPTVGRAPGLMKQVVRILTLVSLSMGRRAVAEFMGPVIHAPR